MEFLVKVEVTLKKTVADPQGQAVYSALRDMGFEGTREVRVGKLIEVRVEGEDREHARSLVDEMCRRLLANPVIEDYRLEVGVDG